MVSPKSLRAVVVAAFVLLPSMVRAQGAETMEAVRRDARVRVGPFYLTPTLLIDHIGVDDNVLLDEKTRQPQSDFTATFTPGLRLRMPVAQRMLISTDVATGLVWYKDFADERSVNPSISGAVDVFVRRLTFQAGASFRQSSDRPTLEIDARSLHKGYGFSGSVGYRFRPKLEFGVSARTSAVRFGQEEIFAGTALRETLNRRTDEFELHVRQTLTPKTRVYVSAVLEDTTFDFLPRRNVDGFRVLPGVGFAATALISGRAEVGYRRLNAESPEVPDFSGVIAAVELSYRLRGATAVTVGWNRDLEFSYHVLRPHFTVNQLLGRVRRQIAGRFDTMLMFRRTYHHYDDVPITEAPDAATEITQDYSADVGYRFNRYTRIGFGVIGADRSSTESPARVYERLRWGLNLTYGLQ